MSLKDDIARKKARDMRYKKPILKGLNLYAIDTWLDEAECTISEVAYATRNDDILMQALDGDEETAFEFKTAFSSLQTDMERFSEDLQAEWVPDCFDEFFALCGAKREDLQGFDEIEEDYLGIGVWEHQYAVAEVTKRLERMTKKQLMEAAMQCFRVGFSYVALQARYTELEAALEILRGENTSLLETIKTIEALYDKAMKVEDEGKAFGACMSPEVMAEFDKLCESLPDECWLR